MPRITININLKAIPGDLIKRVGDAAYVNLDINELRGGADERGNDHSVSVYVPQDRREDYPDRIYIGRGRQYTDQQQAPAPRQQGTGRKYTKQSPIEDLPEGDSGLHF